MAPFEGPLYPPHHGGMLQMWRLADSGVHQGGLPRSDARRPQGRQGSEVAEVGPENKQLEKAADCQHPSMVPLLRALWSL